MGFAIFDLTVLLVALGGIFIEKLKAKEKSSKKEGRHSKRSSFLED